MTAAMKGNATRDAFKMKARGSGVELKAAFERGEIGGEDFHHGAHLELAWAYLSQSSTVEEAATRMRKALRRFTAAVGAPEKYHETVTLFWMRLLDRMTAAQPADTLEEVLIAHPELRRKDLILIYYSADRLSSVEARNFWVEPDLKPFSFDASALCSSD